MSFSAQVKKELVDFEPHAQCCVAAEAYGLLLFGRKFSKNAVSILTDHECVAQVYKQAISETVGVKVRSHVSEAGKHIVSAATSVGRKRILEYFSADDSDMCLRINRANLLNESGDELNCCYSAFLRGAFLSCGTISDPNKNYHLEFCSPHQKLTEDLVKIIDEIGLAAKTAERRGAFVIYFKDSESIEDILTFMGAQLCSLELMQIKMMKSVRNIVNRKNNFDTANMTRTADAAVRQLEAIETIISLGALDSLPEELRELALLRRENFDMSLSNLGKALSTPVSRSGVNHRLQRLIVIANKLKAEEN